MIIIGERINSNSQRIRDAIRNQDLDALRKEAALQAEAGVDYLDVNASELLEEEATSLTWLVSFLQEASGLPLAIDSPSPSALAAGLAAHKGRALLNSISGESERYASVIPLIKEFQPRVIALCMDDRGMPQSPEDRVRVAHNLVTGITNSGVAEEDIFLDPLVKPVGVDPSNGLETLDSVSALRKEFPRCHITIGLSNVSFGMPKGKWLNRAFLVLAMGRGLDSTFCDPADQNLLALLLATRVLNGQDEFGMKYLKAARAEKLNY